MPHLHLTLLSTTSASIPTALLLASRAAFIDLKIPQIKRIGYEAITTSGDKDLSGIKAAVRAGRGGKGKGVVRGGGGGGASGEDWDLDEGFETVQGREGLPVLVTLNLVSEIDQRRRVRADESRSQVARWYFSTLRCRRKRLVQIGYTSSLLARGGYVGYG